MSGAKKPAALQRGWTRFFQRSFFSFVAVEVWAFSLWWETLPPFFFFLAKENTAPCVCVCVLMCLCLSVCVETHVTTGFVQHPLSLLPLSQLPLAPSRQVVSPLWSVELSHTAASPLLNPTGAIALELWKAGWLVICLVVFVCTVSQSTNASFFFFLHRFTTFLEQLKFVSETVAQGLALPPPCKMAVWSLHVCNKTLHVWWIRNSKLTTSVNGSLYVALQFIAN